LGIPPFGYTKSKTEKGKLIVDGEAADCVRLIFSLLTEGNNFTQIAYILNAQGIPSPAEYKRERGFWHHRRQEGSDYEFWTSGTVGNIVNNMQYTGAVAGFRSTTVCRGVKRTFQKPKDEWIIVPNAHEAIISKEDYDRALEVFRRRRRADAPVDHIFHGMVKCPACGRTMKRINPRNPAFKCYTRYYTDRYACPGFTVPQAKIEEVVLASLRAFAAVCIDREEMKLRLIGDCTVAKAELENRIKAGRDAVRLLEESVTKNFTLFASGSMTKEVFLSKKEVSNNTISRKNADTESLREQLAAVTSGKYEIEERLSDFNSLLTVEKLDKELVGRTIDKIIVHGEKEFEIVWKDNTGTDTEENSIDDSDNLSSHSQ
jgi:hypothetical protein